MNRCYLLWIVGSSVDLVEAVGLMWIYPSTTSSDRLSVLHAPIQKLRDNSNDELVQWKIVRALESFNHPNSLTVLREIIYEGLAPAIHYEAQRSPALAAKQPAISTLNGRPQLIFANSKLMEMAVVQYGPR